MGVEEEFEFIRYKPNDNPDANVKYRKDVHPHGTIPALVVPGRPQLLESGGICLHLADKYGKPGKHGKRQLITFSLFIMYGKATLDELMDFYFFLWVEKRVFSEEKQKSVREKFDSCMEYLAKRLEGRKFLCGNKFTVADCVVGYDIYLAVILNDGELLKKHPKILEYYGRLKDREAFQETIRME